MPQLNVEWISRRQRLILQSGMTIPYFYSVFQIYSSSLSYRTLILFAIDTRDQYRFQLFRRPLLTQHPLYAILPAILALLLVLLLVVFIFSCILLVATIALGFNWSRALIPSFLIIIFGPCIVIFVYDPIRPWLAMFTYVKWLKSFNEGDDGCSVSENQKYAAGRGKFRRFRWMNGLKRLMARFIARQRTRWNASQAARAGLSQISISLPIRRPIQSEEEQGRDISMGDDVDNPLEEFPGEVFLG